MLKNEMRLQALADWPPKAQVFATNQRFLIYSASSRTTVTGPSRPEGNNGELAL